MNISLQNSTIKQKSSLEKGNMHKINDMNPVLFKLAQLRKRNVVSLLFKKPLIRKLCYAVLLFVVVAQPSFAELHSTPSIIQEESTRFQSETITYPAVNTFMIESGAAKRKQACSGIESAGKNCRLPIAYFQLGSARLPSSERQSVLDAVQRCGVSKTTSLHITGYTCSLGAGQENQMLSLHRAQEVANVLRVHGYAVKVEDIKGRGEEIPLTTDKQKIAINRRVEITE